MMNVEDAFDRPAPFGRTIDGSVIPSALNDPNSIDYRMVNGIPGARQYVEGLAHRDMNQFGRITGHALNQDFLNNYVSRVYGVPFS